MILSKGLTRLGGVVALAALLLAAGLASAPSAHAQAPVPVLPVPTWLWGPAAAADSVIVASVDGVGCKTAEVDAATLVWAVQIDDGECGAASGSEITFTVGGVAANETVAWSAGGASEVTLTYDMGDMGGDGDGDMDGDGDGDMDGDGDDTMTPEPPKPPDTGNAGLAGTSSSSPWLALGLGALAVAMLAGARSVTGRVR